MENETIDQNFIKELENGSVNLHRLFSEEESKEYWKLIHSVTNIKNFKFRDSGFLKDIEENIPKVIERNPNLLLVSLEFNNEIIDFDTKLLKQSFKNNSSLKYLTVRYFRKEKVIKSLFECFEDSFISELSLTYIEINKSVFKSISKMKYLQSLTFIDCEFTESSYEPLISVKYTHFYINFFSSAPEDELPYKILESLNISNFLLIKSGCKPIEFKKFSDSLKCCPNLYEIALFDITEFQNLDYLKNVLNQNLQVLNISSFRVEFEVNLPYISFLKDNNSLKKLTLNGVEDFKELDTFLLNNQVIQELNVGSIHNNMKILSQGLSNHHSLQSLSFKNLSDDDFQYLNHDFIFNTRNLKSLSINQCNIDDEMCSFFKEFLLTNKVLKYFKLSNSKFGEKVVKSICDGLKDSKIIKYLDLEKNTIDDEGCKHLGNLLKFNKSIQELHLRYNKIGMNGINYITEVLGYNSTLIHLGCQKIDWEKDQENVILNNLFYNHSLQDCIIGLDGNERFDFLMARNSTFITTLQIAPYFDDINFIFD